jgi:hypothetical protein
MPISQELLHFPHIYAGIQQQSGRRGPQRVGGMRVLSADVGIVLGSPFAPWEAVQVVLDQAVHRGLVHPAPAELFTPAIQQRPE